jgi:hypothetical protein
MLREQIEVGARQAGNQFAFVRTCKCATCEWPETNKNPARPRRAHGSTRNPAVLHGRALSVGPTVPNDIITLGCPLALGLSGGKALRFRGNCPANFAVVPHLVVSGRGRQPLQHSIAATDRIPFYHICGHRLDYRRSCSSPPIVIGHRPHGYWTSVQSIDRMRWRTVYIPAACRFLASARGSLARGALPRPLPPAAPRAPRCETSRHWTTVQSISRASSP